MVSREGYGYLGEKGDGKARKNFFAGGVDIEDKGEEALWKVREVLTIPGHGFGWHFGWM